MTPRVDMLHTAYPHWGEFTGVRPFVRELRRQGSTIAVRSIDDSDEGFPIRNTRFRDSLRKRLSRRMAWYKLSDFSAEVRTGIRCLLRRCDIVHFVDGEHSAHYLPLAIKNARLLAGRTVATFHQPPDQLAQLVDRRVVACLDSVVIVSPTQRPFFEERVSPERVRQILWGVDTDYFRPATKAIGEHFQCVTVGHWLRDWTAMQALARLLVARRSDITLHVITDHETGLEGLPNVHRHYRLTDSELLAIYQQSDALLLPLTGSTANNSLLEGLACGLPIISTDLPSIRAYVPTPAALLVPENDPDLLFRALETVRSDEARRVTMGKLARDRAEELSWTRIAPCYARLYSDLI